MGKLREPAKCLSPVFKEIWLILTFNIFWCIVCTWMSHSQQKNSGSIFVQVHSSVPVHFLFFTHLQHLYLMKCILFHWRWWISVADQVSLESVGLIAISLSRLPTLMHHHHLLYPVWQQFYWSISLSTVFLLLGVQVSLYNVEYARQGKKPKEIYDPTLLYAYLGLISAAWLFWFTHSELINPQARHQKTNRLQLNNWKHNTKKAEGYYDFIWCLQSNISKSLR